MDRPGSRRGNVRRRRRPPVGGEERDWGLRDDGRPVPAGCNASRRLPVAVRVPVSAHSCVWDPDEMAVIHPS
jgi:hypothetical protein